MSVHTFSSPSAAALLVTLAPVLVQFVVFLRWLHRRMRNDEITRAFVRDIATNHLPHIYNALQKIAAQQGIDLDETPLHLVRYGVAAPGTGMRLRRLRCRACRRRPPPWRVPKRIFRAGRAMVRRRTGCFCHVFFP